MKLQTVSGEIVEIDEREVFRAAGVARQALRVRRAGGRPPALRPCPYCGELQLGLATLELHGRVCPKRPPETRVPFTSEDLAALDWLPEPE